MKGKTIYWLKWFAVLPTSIIAYLLGNLLSIGVFWVANELDALTWVSEHFSKEIAAGIASYFFMSAGIVIAPSHKKITALVLLIVFVLLSGFTMFPNIYNKQYENIVTGIIEIVVAICVFLATKGTEGELDKLFND